MTEFIHWLFFAVKYLVIHLMWVGVNKSVISHFKVYFYIIQHTVNMLCTLLRDPKILFNCRKILPSYAICVTTQWICTFFHCIYSTGRHYLVVPRHSLSSYGRRAFAVAGPTAWNSLSDDLHDPKLISDSFRRLLKIQLFSEYIQRIWGIALYAHYIYSRLTYLHELYTGWAKLSDTTLHFYL